MSTYYLDSSAIVKRYAPELGTEWIRGLTTGHNEHTLLLSEITIAEVAAALSAKQRSPKGLSVAERDRALSLFLSECRDQYFLLIVDRDTIDLAVDLALRHPLRGYDAVQLATALLANRDLTAAGSPPITFVTADLDLLDAASTEALETENPNLHT